MAPKARYQEGDVFAVPLRDGGYGVGVVARSKGKGLVLGHFFGPRYDAVPGLDEVGRLEGVEYADDDPNSRPREVEVSREEFEHLHEDGLAGFGFTEARLTRLLAA